MTLDIKEFYYGIAMARYEYMKLTLACILDEIINQYSLYTLSYDGWVYLETRKGMPGLICGPNSDTWIKAIANNSGRLTQGVGTRMPTGTNTVFFVAKSAISHGRKVTYS